jgi:hypothetical protein
MAFLPDEQNPLVQKQDANGASGPSDGAAGAEAQQAPITSSAAPTSGGGANKTINQASSAAPAQPFTNLQAYLTANAPQIQAQGDQIAGTLNSQYGQTTGAIDAAKTGFADQVKQGYTPNNAQVVNNFSADPTAVANDPNAAKTFQGMFNDSYTGPASFESTSQYGGLNDQVQKGKAMAAQVSNQGGLQSYLMGQNPNETQGMATLDSTLMSANPGAVTNVQNAAKQYDNLPSYLTGAVDQGNQSVQQAIAEAQAAKQASRGAFDTQANALKTGVQSDFQTALDSAKAQSGDYNDIIARLSHIMPTGYDDGLQQLSTKEQSALGVSNEALNKYAQANQILQNYNNGGELSRYATASSGMGNADVAPLSTYLSGGGPSALPQDPSTVASAKQYDIAKALSALGGQEYSSPLDLSKANLAGTYQPTGSFQHFDTARANGLFDQVSARDKVFGDQMISNTPGIAPGDYKAALDKLQKEAPSDGGALLTLAALNRLANGFDAPAAGFTPAPITPTIGGGLSDTTPKVTSGGGGFATR